MLPIYRLAALLALTHLSLLTQVDRATLSGVVTDPSGAVLSRASIAIESPTNGLKREVKSAANGTYQLLGLPIGTYTVSVSLNGFSTAKFDSVVLAVGQSRVIDAQLQVGAVSTSFEVNAATTPLEQTSAEIGAVIGEQQIKNIPLNGRHWASLMALAAGAVNVGEGN